MLNPILFISALVCVYRLEVIFSREMQKRFGVFCLHVYLREINIEK